MFTGVTLPFTSAEMMTAAFEFIKLLGPFVLVGLAIALTPRIINVIKGAIGRGGRNAA